MFYSNLPKKEGAELRKWHVLVCMIDRVGGEEPNTGGGELEETEAVWSELGVSNG